MTRNEEAMVVSKWMLERLKREYVLAVIYGISFQFDQVEGLELQNGVDFIFWNFHQKPDTS